MIAIEKTQFSKLHLKKYLYYITHYSKKILEIAHKDALKNLAFS